MDIPLSLVIPLASAAAGFIFTLAQKNIELRKARRSVAVAILVEINSARSSARAIKIQWDSFLFDLSKPDYTPLLVISRDIKVLSRLNIETLALPALIVSHLTHFHNSVSDFYKCLETINSENFSKISIDQKKSIINMTIEISKDVELRADNAINSMLYSLPCKWFSELHEELESNKVIL